MSKYGNTKEIIDGITFDSQKEANRYCELRLLQRAGKIDKLELQKEFELIPAQFESIKVGNTWKRGKCVERACRYRCDFYYWDCEKQNWVCEDVKGYKTDVYKIKRKLLRYRYGIEVREV